MTQARQDPAASIESALAELRHRQRAWRHGPGFGPDGMHRLHGAMHGAHPGGHHGGPHGGRAKMAAMIGAARFRMLEAVETAPASVSDIAAAIGVDQPRASRLVADAAARRLVERKPDPVDARRILVTITPAGRELLASMRSTRLSAVETALDGFSAQERDTLAALLTRFAHAWPTAT